MKGRPRPKAPGWWVVCVLFVPISFGSATQSDLSTLSERALFRLAEDNYRVGNFEEARRALIAAFEQREQKNRGRPKPHNKYSPMLDAVNTELADRTALSGMEMCESMALEECEAALEKAADYARSPRVVELEQRFGKGLAEVRRRLDDALALAQHNRFDDALSALEALQPFSRYLPDLVEHTEQTRKQYGRYLVAQGFAALNGYRWADASANFSRALAFEENKDDALRGLEAVERGKEADALAVLAAENLRVNRFEDAMGAIEAARAKYPESPKFNPLREEIADKWAASIVQSVPALMLARGSFRASRDAYLLLQRLGGLNPAHPLRGRMNEARSAFGTAALTRALELEVPGDFSRVASALALKINAGRLLGEGVVPEEELKTTAHGFHRKRAAQLILSVENLAGAPGDFESLVMLRTRHAIEGLGLPDLRMRTREEYLASPDEDPQFQDLRPDNTSLTAILSVSIDRYEAERWTSEHPERVRSKFQSGTREVPNPQYESMRAELAAIERSLAGGRKNIREGLTPEGYSTRSYDRLRLEFQKLSPTLEEPVYTDYEYFKFEHHQDVRVELTIVMRDYFTRERLAEEKISFSDESSGIEFRGVHEADVSDAAVGPVVGSTPVGLPDAEQLLRQRERDALEDLTKKVLQVAPSFLDRFYRAGIKALKAGNPADAAEYLFCHWTFFRGRIHDERTEEIAGVLARELGFDLGALGGEAIALVNRLAPAIR